MTPVLRQLFSAPAHGALLALALAACAPSVAEPPIADQWRNVELEVSAAPLGAERIGVLQFRGGVQLRSRDAAFGGWSGMEVMDDGRLLAVSDAGTWLSARIVTNGAGDLVGVADARLAAMRDEHGHAFEHKEDGDAEDLAQLPDGRFAVSFEQTQSIRIYDLNRDGPFGAAAPGPVLADVARLPLNAGLEALTATADGALLAGAEDAGTLWRAPLSAAAPAPPSARYPLAAGFSLVSLDRLPDNTDFVALERFYAPVIGVRTRIARVAADTITSGGEVRKTEWALLAPPLALDNFEAVSAVRAPGGGLRLYIISDDNFSARQRTLLYAFDVALD